MNIVIMLSNMTSVGIALYYIVQLLRGNKILGNKSIVLPSLDTHKVLRRFILINFSLSLVLIIMWVMGLVNREEHSFITFVLFGLIPTIMTYAWTIRAGVLIGENGFVINGNYYTWDDERVKIRIVNNDNTEFYAPYSIQVMLNDSQYVILVPSGSEHKVATLLEGLSIQINNREKNNPLLSNKRM